MLYWMLNNFYSLYLTFLYIVFSIWFSIYSAVLDFIFYLTQLYAVFKSFFCFLLLLYMILLNCIYKWNFSTFWNLLIFAVWAPRNFLKVEALWYKNVIETTLIYHHKYYILIEFLIFQFFQNERSIKIFWL